QRTIKIAPEWASRRILLTLERPHWETRAWLGDRELGRGESLSTAHVYDLSGAAPGQHRLTIRVDNRLLVDVGPNAHSVSDHTQTNWHGIVGKIELRAGSPVWIDTIQVFPIAVHKRAHVQVRLGNALGAPGRATLTLRARPANGAATLAPLEVSVELSTDGALVELDYPLG